MVALEPVVFAISFMRTTLESVTIQSDGDSAIVIKFPTIRESSSYDSGVYSLGPSLTLSYESLLMRIEKRKAEGRSTSLEEFGASEYRRVMGEYKAAWKERNERAWREMDEKPPDRPCGEEE